MGLVIFLIGLPLPVRLAVSKRAFRLMNSIPGKQTDPLSTAVLQVAYHAIFNAFAYLRTKVVTNFLLTSRLPNFPSISNHKIRLDGLNFSHQYFSLPSPQGHLTLMTKVALGMSIVCAIGAACMRRNFEIITVFCGNVCQERDTSLLGESCQESGETKKMRTIRAQAGAKYRLGGAHSALLSKKAEMCSRAREMTRRRRRISCDLSWCQRHTTPLHTRSSVIRSHAETNVCNRSHF